MGNHGQSGLGSHWKLTRVISLKIATNLHLKSCTKLKQGQIPPIPLAMPDALNPLWCKFFFWAEPPLSPPYTCSAPGLGQASLMHGRDLFDCCIGASGLSQMFLWEINSTIFQCTTLSGEVIQKCCFNHVLIKVLVLLLLLFQYLCAVWWRSSGYWTIIIFKFILR